MRSSFPPASGALVALLIALASLLHTPSPGAAQGFGALVAECGGASETLTLLCHNAALALEGGRGGLATAATRGSEVPGSASTMGYRIRGFPRFALSARGGLARFSMADLTQSSGPAGDPAPAPFDGVLLPSLHLSGTLGLFQGFSPEPTVGGVLALDLTASVDKVFAPRGIGFQDGLLGWGVGARVGILRESFTLPGVSVSATSRWMGSATVGGQESAGMAEANFDVNVTSLRGVVGKDLLGLGFLAGAGWDRISGDGTIRARVSSTGPEGTASSTGLSSKRVVFFGGASMTFLILQVSGEAGWSRALDQELPRSPGGSTFPSKDVYFGSVAFRVTF